MSNQNELLETLKGFLLLLLFHLCAGVIIFLLGWLSSPIGNYTILFVWIIGAIGFFFWQLLYVIPLIIWLKRRRKMGMMKGVIIGAVLTALLNGSCYLLWFR
jgi:hypothetical protein